MNQFEIRESIISEATIEAENGLWQDLDKDTFVFCVRDAMVSERSIGRILGVIWALKSKGNVSVEPYCQEGEQDDGAFIRITIKPRA